MDSDLYKSVYCSRNETRGNSEEMADALLSLLEAARAKNLNLDITGALISQGGVFAESWRARNSRWITSLALSSMMAAIAT